MILVTGMTQAGRGFIYKVFSENGDNFTPKVWGNLTNTTHPWCTDEGPAITSAIDGGISNVGLERLLKVIPSCWSSWKNEIVFKASEMVFYPSVVGKVFSRVIVCFRPISEWEKTILLRKEESVKGWMNKPDKENWKSQYSERLGTSKNFILDLAQIWEEASNALVDCLKVQKKVIVYPWNFGDKDGFFDLLSDFEVPEDKIEVVWTRYWAGSILEGKGV